MRQKPNLLSLVVPVHNEANNLAWHHDKIVNFFNKYRIKKEIIYIDDGSNDGSLDIIEDLVKKDKDVQFISLSRNFGKEVATSAGIQQSNGDVVVMIDADGQHPVELIDSFLAEWRRGSDVVIGVRTQNKNEGFIKRYGSKLHNAILNLLTDTGSVSGATDFRLIDRRVADEFSKLTERNRLTRGLIDWLGFQRSYVPFVSPQRHGGTATYSFSKLVKLALHSFTSQSTKPLLVTGFLGFIVTILSSILGIFLAVESYILDDPLNLEVTGTAMLALLLSFLVGLVLICQWLLALYIESIHNETQNRPLYIIARKSK